MSVETLTYGALAERLGISPSAAQSLARRLRLPRSLASDRKALVTVDLGEITHRPRPPREPVRPEAKIASLQAQITQLQTTAATHRADFERERDRADRLVAELREATAESTTAMHRADFERERDRAERLVAELVKATAETTAAKEATARLEGEVAALRSSAQWSAQGGPPDRLRQLAASVVEADRRARR